MKDNMEVLEKSHLRPPLECICIYFAPRPEVYLIIDDELEMEDNVHEPQFYPMQETGLDVAYCLRIH